MKNNISLYLILGSVLLLGIIFYVFNFRTVEVTFDAKMGAGILPVTLKVGEKVEEPTPPTSSEYNFMGWYLNGEKYDFNTPVKNDITLEAKWEEK